MFVWQIGVSLDVVFGNQIPRLAILMPAIWELRMSDKKMMSVPFDINVFPQNTCFLFNKYHIEASHGVNIGCHGVVRPHVYSHYTLGHQGSNLRAGNNTMYQSH